MHSFIHRFILDINKPILVLNYYLLLQIQSETSEVLDLADALVTLIDLTLHMRICPKLKKYSNIKKIIN